MSQLEKLWVRKITDFLPGPFAKALYILLEREVGEGAEGNKQVHSGSVVVIQWTLHVLQLQVNGVLKTNSGRLPDLKLLPLHLQLLESGELLVIPAQELAVELLGRIQGQLGHDMTRLLGSEQTPSLFEFLELGSVLGVHAGVMDVPNGHLHIGVNYAWANGDGCDIWLLDGESAGKMIQYGFAGTVGSPSGIVTRGGTRRAENDAAFGVAKGG